MSISAESVYLVLTLTAFLVVGIYHLVKAKRATAEARGSLKWPYTHGYIVESRIDQIVELDGSKSSVPVIVYKFTVDGHERTGNTIAFGLNDMRGPSSVGEKYTSRYPVGTRVVVYYDPHGRACVLQRRNTESTQQLFNIGIGFTVMGVVFTILFLVFSDG